MSRINDLQIDDADDALILRNKVPHLGCAAELPTV
jgi:hypothetical protein